MFTHLRTEKWVHLLMLYPPESLLSPFFTDEGSSGGRRHPDYSACSADDSHSTYLFSSFGMIFQSDILAKKITPSLIRKPFLLSGPAEHAAEPVRSTGCAPVPTGLQGFHAPFFVQKKTLSTSLCCRVTFCPEITLYSPGRPGRHQHSQDAADKGQR